MKRYLEQLIDDLHKTTLNMKPPHEIWEDLKDDPDNEVEDMSQVEKYMYGDDEPISGITGIDHEQLPPVEKLSQQQQALLAVELEKLLQYFHFYLDFPENYPAHLRYSFILKFWEEKHVALSFGENHIEFCSYDEEHCPFPGYCNNCQEMEAEWKSDEENFGKGNVEIDENNYLPSPEEVEKWMKDQKIDTNGETENELFPFEISEKDEPYSEDRNGFYDDDGNKIDLNSIPVPSLCIICRKHHIEDWDENLLCLMNRNDQRDEPDFKCSAFEKL